MFFLGCHRASASLTSPRRNCPRRGKDLCRRPRDGALETKRPGGFTRIVCRFDSGVYRLAGNARGCGAMAVASHAIGHEIKAQLVIGDEDIFITLTNASGIGDAEGQDP